MTGINRVRKGLAIERFAIAILEREGYVVHRCVRHVIRVKGQPRTMSNDIYGAVDLVAKRINPASEVTGPGAAATRWIQVTGGYGVKERADKLRTVPWHPSDSPEVWRWVDGSGSHLDKRTISENCPEGRPRPRMYFQVYLHWEDYRLDRRNRIFLHPEAGEERAAPEAPILNSTVEGVTSEGMVSPLYLPPPPPAIDSRLAIDEG